MFFALFGDIFLLEFYRVFLSRLSNFFIVHKAIENGDQEVFSFYEIMINNNHRSEKETRLIIKRVKTNIPIQIEQNISYGFNSNAIKSECFFRPVVTICISKTESASPDTEVRRTKQGVQLSKIIFQLLF